MSFTYHYNPTSLDTSIEVFPPSNINASGILTYSGNKQHFDYPSTNSLYSTNVFTFSKGGTPISPPENSSPPSGSFPVQVDTNTYWVYPMVCELRAPTGNTADPTGNQMWINPLLQYTSNPQDQYPPSNNWTATGSDAGPSMTDSFFGSDANTNYPNPSVFYINPCVAEAFQGGQKQFPVYSFVGSPYFSTSGNANSPNVIQNAQNTDSANWMLYYQMSLSNVCGTTTEPAPISGNIGFPIVYSITGTGAFYNFLFFQVIFVLPLYGGQYITNAEISSSKFPGWVPNSVPTFPGYLLAFYKRLPALCQSAPCPYEQSTTISSDNLQQNPYNKNTNIPGRPNTSYGFGNYFPVIYEATNMREQNSGNLPENASLLYMLNKIATTNKPTVQPYSTIHDALSGLGWLEYTTNNNGVSLGNVQTVDGAKKNLGDNWYFGGYVPFNFSSTSNKQTWSSSIDRVATVSLSTDANNGTPDGWTPFMKNQIVMATTVPIDSSGNPYQYYAADPSGNTNVPLPNTFWKSVKTKTVPLSTLYSPVSTANTPNVVPPGGTSYTIPVFIKGGYFVAYQTTSPAYPAARYPQDSPVPYITLSLNDPYRGGYKHLACNVYATNGLEGRNIYNTIVFTPYWDGGVNGAIQTQFEVFNWTRETLTIKIRNENGSYVGGYLCAGQYGEFRSSIDSRSWSNGPDNRQRLSNNAKAGSATCPVSRTNADYSPCCVTGFL